MGLWARTIFLGSFVVCTGAFAQSVEQIFINFDDYELKESGSLILNLEQNRLHVPLQIDGHSVGGVPGPTRTMEIGDGRHGEFISSRYHLFSQGGDLSGQIIRLPLADFPTLQVTRFELENGWTLEPVGSGFLQIYSHGDVIIDGVINCSGHPGQDGVLGAGVVPSLGGEGRCGGLRGGNGGASGVNADKGQDAPVAMTFPTGGNPGQSSVGSGGGGGGGGGSYYSNTLNDGAAKAGASVAGALGGSRGESNASAGEVNFTNLMGGAGGGGGGAHNLNSGGAGGGGGGVVVIHTAGSVTMGGTGQILAQGGLGGAGADDGGTFSGRGGQGGGGSILVASREDNILGGEINAMDNFNAGEPPGAGGSGRTWIARRVENGPAGYTGNFPIPDSLRTYQGEVEDRLGTFNFLSKPIDLGSVQAEFKSIVLGSVNYPANGSFSVRVRGANTLGELSLESLELFEDVIDPINAPQARFRYFQFEVALNNTSPTQAISLGEITFDFDVWAAPEPEPEPEPTTPKDNYDYIGKCSQIYMGKPPSSGFGFFWWIFVMSPLLVFWGGQRIRAQWSH